MTPCRQEEERRRREEEMRRQQEEMMRRQQEGFKGTFPDAVYLSCAHDTKNSAVGLENTIGYDQFFHSVTLLERSSHRKER